MPTPTVWPSVKRVAGLAKETTQGTAVTPPTVTYPCDAFLIEDDYKQLKDKASRGSMVDQYDTIQGVALCNVTGSGPYFGDCIGHWLLNMFGDLTTTPGTPNTHAFSVLNTGTGQPPTHTGTQWQGTPTNQSRVAAGICLAELTFKGNVETGLVTAEFKGQGWKSSPSGSAITYPAPSTIAAIAGWHTTIGIGGTAVGAPNKHIGEWSVTFTREIKANFTAQGIQDPYTIFRGEMGVTGDFSITKPSDETELLYYINNTVPQLQIVVDNGVVGANNINLQIDIQRAAFAPVKIDFGEPEVGYSASFTGNANTTNIGASGGYGVGKVTIKNAVASY